MKQRTMARWAAVAIVVTAACAARRQSDPATYHDPAMDFSLVRTVAVLPFENLTSTPAAAERVRNVFMTMMQATGSAYVLPPGEVSRGIDRASIPRPTAPTAEQVVNLGKIVGADAVITGVLREYGEVRSGTASAGVVSLSLQMIETQTGKVVWSAASSRGGVDAADRLFGGGGQPMEAVTAAAVGDLLDELFR